MQPVGSRCSPLALIWGNDIGGPTIAPFWKAGGRTRPCSSLPLCLLTKWVSTRQGHLSFSKEGHSSSVCIPPGYNKEIGPWKYRHLADESLPWYFMMDFYIFDVQEINDQKLTITFDVYFKLKWSEPRFQVNTSSDTWQTSTTLIDGEEYYLLPLDTREDLWIPALEMHNVESFIPQKIFRE